MTPADSAKQKLSASLKSRLPDGSSYTDGIVDDIIAAAQDGIIEEVRRKLSALFDMQIAADKNRPTLRDYFAAEALSGMVSCPEPTLTNCSPVDAATAAYHYADAMMAAREQGESLNDLVKRSEEKAKKVIAETGAIRDPIKPTSTLDELARENKILREQRGTLVSLVERARCGCFSLDCRVHGAYCVIDIALFEKLKANL